MTSSATLRVLLNGALNTATPRLVAAARSTWLVPMQKQPTATSLRAASKMSSVSWVRERMPTKWAPAMVLRRQGLLVQLDIVVAGVAQGLYRGGVHPLQQEELDLAFLKRLGRHKRGCSRSCCIVGRCERGRVCYHRSLVFESP